MILRDGSSPSSGPPGGSDCATGAGQVPAPRFSDDELERRIEFCRVNMTVALAPDDKRYWFGRMRNLIAQRSPEQIARMEKERKLTQP